jgi:hypothetical protein
MSTCSFCNKPYKSRGALIKHAAKCTARIENITADIVEPPKAAAAKPSAGPASSAKPSAAPLQSVRSDI